MSTIARRFVACPVRTAGDVWKEITSLCTAISTAAKADFDAAQSIAATLIADEMLKENPFVIKGSGPRLRVYCLYGDDAIDGAEKSEDSLVAAPCAGAWIGYLPCSEKELATMKKLLAAKTSRFELYDPQVGLPEDDARTVQKAGLSIDLEALENL